MAGSMDRPIPVIGAGLAGSEAALQLADAGYRVQLYEMRPVVPTAAHQSDHCAELVCSNSLGSKLPDRAGGVLQAELRALDCKLLPLAEACSVPAGQALAVDREQFGAHVTAVIEAHPNIELIRQEVHAIPDDPITIVASGPLTGEDLAADIQRLAGAENLAFFDAIAPVVYGESLDRSIVFAASRWDKGTADYLNVPLDEAAYELFVDELLAAEKHDLKGFESADPRAHHFFERCLPIEVLAARGRETLRFGPMRPVGLDDPRTGRWTHGILQLRKENTEGTLYNMVGFQTKLTYGEQKRVFRLIPGLENAEFARLGGLHRNTFLNSPKLCDETMRMQAMPRLRFAGQITGCEGYVESAAVGLMVGLFTAAEQLGKDVVTPPPTTALGALLSHLTGGANEETFQPMNVNFGLFPPLDTDHLPKKQRPRGRDRKKVVSDRAKADLGGWLDQISV